jgi:hypothetical protein
MHTVCWELAELSARDCKKALCLDILGEGGSSEVRVDVMSYVELTLWLCACRELEEDNK